MRVGQRWEGTSILLLGQEDLASVGADGQVVAECEDFLAVWRHAFCKGSRLLFGLFLGGVAGVGFLGC